MALTWIDMLGYLASASVLATFCMRRMVPLRIMALVSNLLFLGFGGLAHVYPVMILHLVLLPVNAASLLQLFSTRRGSVPHGVFTTSVNWLTSRYARAGYRAGHRGAGPRH
jgi:CRP/FNR family cyclic AMP-dependent transcriptional regulator